MVCFYLKPFFGNLDFRNFLQKKLYNIVTRFDAVADGQVAKLRTNIQNMHNGKQTHQA